MDVLKYANGRFKIANSANVTRRMDAHKKMANGKKGTVVLWAFFVSELFDLYLNRCKWIIEYCFFSSMIGFVGKGKFSYFVNYPIAK